MSFRRINSSSSTCGTRRITLTTNIYEIQINIYIYFFIFIFIWISYLDIRCRQNNHGRWAMELGLHHQHDKSGWCWCMKSMKITKGLSEAVNRKSTYNTMARWKRTNNDLQNIAQKTKDRATRTSLKTGGELRCSGRVSRSCSTSTSLYVHQILLLSVYNIYQLLVNWWYLHRKIHFSKKVYECKWTCRFTHILGYELFSWLKIQLWLWNVEQQ